MQTSLVELGLVQKELTIEEKDIVIALSDAQIKQGNDKPLEE